MTPEAFSQGIDHYARRTVRAPPSPTRSANYGAIGQTATLRELDEVATRLVASGRVPKWPDEHLRAIVAELDALRAEDAAKRRPVRDQSECVLCGGTGLVIVPHPCCVWRGQIRPYYSPRTKTRYRSVIPVSVLCCCPAGDRAKQANRKYAEERNRSALMTIDSYTRRIGGHDGIALMREWESRQARLARAAQPPDRSEQDLFRRIIANIQARDDEAEEYEDEAIPV